MNYMYCWNDEERILQSKERRGGEGRGGGEETKQIRHLCERTAI